jgi:mevalonate pyrophosphate decarboxylase
VFLRTYKPSPIPSSSISFRFQQFLKITPTLTRTKDPLQENDEYTLPSDAKKNEMQVARECTDECRKPTYLEMMQN